MLPFATGIQKAIGLQAVFPAERASRPKQLSQIQDNGGGDVLARPATPVWHFTRLTRTP